MMLKIGEKIKELREKKNITQNKMAEYLGITEQAISRWENGGGYPDMELIPAISNFLEVSTDALFETDRKAERLKSLVNEANKNLDWDHKTNCRRIEMFRNILKEFPSDYNSMSFLSRALSYENYNPPGKHSEEIIALCNRIINDCPSIGMQREATYSLAQAYKNKGEREKAVKTLKESTIIHSLQNGIHYSREYMLSFTADGEEVASNLKYMLTELCGELCSGIWNNLICMEYDAYIRNDALSNEEWLEVLKRHIIIVEKIEKIIGAFYEDEDYGFYREGMLYHYCTLANYYMIFGEYDKALENIEKCAETAIIFDTEKPSRHTSILAKDIKIQGDYQLSNYGNHEEDIKYNQSYRLIHDYFSSKNNTVLVPVGEKRERKSYYEFYAPIRGHERFKAVIANLEKHAKIER